MFENLKLLQSLEHLKLKITFSKRFFLTYQVLITCYYLTKIIPVKKIKFFYKDIGHLSLKAYQCVFMRCVLYICIFVYVYIIYILNLTFVLQAFNDYEKQN